jgi:hypothetical protein
MQGGGYGQRVIILLVALFPAACRDANPLYQRGAVAADAQADRREDAVPADVPADRREDAVGSVRSCIPGPPLPGTLALFDFEDGVSPLPVGSTVFDVQRAHPALVHGTGLTFGDGPAGCGRALVFPATNAASFLEIADSPAFDLAEGSIDFWFRPNRCPQGEAAGLLSRDAMGEALPGHLAVNWGVDCQLAVRLQRPGFDTAEKVPGILSLNVWHHIGMNFGPQGLVVHLGRSIHGSSV